MRLLSCASTLANLRDIIRDYDRLGDGVWDSSDGKFDPVVVPVVYRHGCPNIKIM
ncbi:MAG: hypothetical protein KAR85_03280 [Methanosarcinales archaeon]|nr:hypothetical protein [Methanosarcinales archaeon]